MIHYSKHFVEVYVTLQQLTGEAKAKRTYYGLKLLSISPSLYSSTLRYQQQ